MSIGATTIEYLQLRGAMVDAPIARQRLSYLFSSTVLQPYVMAPSAVLVVRSMSDPLPGRIALEFASAAAPSMEWENAAKVQLEEIYRRAARPAAGAVPPSAEAILFADQGELLACLALDVDAHAANSWWWKSILRHRFSGQASGWLDVWAQHPRYVPSALQQLEKFGKSTSILNRMTPSQAWRLLLGVAQAFGLPESAFHATEQKFGVWSDPEAGTGHSRHLEQQFGAVTENTASRPEVTAQMLFAHSTDAAVRPPWESYLVTASIPEELGLERRTLLGVSLLLVCAPHRALSERFACELNAWLRNKRKEASQSAAIDQHRNDEGASGIRFLPLDANRNQSAAQTEENEDAARSVNADAVGLSRQRDPLAPISILDEGAAAAGWRIFAAASAPRSADLSSDMPAKKSADQTQLPFQNGCRTRLGGVFYLVHLLRQSRLLDFGVGLGGWALLELFARCLLARVSFDVSGDLAWLALAQLDGRDEGAHPGTGFEPLLVYEAPECWLRNLDSTTRYIRFRSRRVELWHPEGFLTLDSQDESSYPSSNDPSSLNQFPPLGRPQRRAFRSATQVRLPSLTLTPELRRFLHFVLPYARWRLRQTTRNARIEDILLCEGTLYVTHSHVDFVTGMNQISIPARLAGLDANPGWAPEFGKVINFHFVQKGFGHA
ncbi:MAG TPA: hypothetical protein VGG56_10260 [Terracidiphilus sp.]|jgi:hypothetical protein